MTNTPIISFVTPCFNRRDFVVRCIESIPESFRSQVEHIIIDGGSKDGSVDLIKAYPHVILISEPDDGLYDAANKGIEIARGKYIGFLATDDFVSRSFFDNFFINSEDWKSEESILCFDWVRHSDGVSQLVHAMRFDVHCRNSIFSMLIRQEIWKLLSGFNKSYKIAGDIEFMLRMSYLDLNSKILNYEIQNFWMHKDSLTGHLKSSRDKEYKEVVRILFNNYFNIFKNMSKQRKGFYLMARKSIDQVILYYYRTGNTIYIFSSFRLLVLSVLSGVLFERAFSFLFRK